MSPGNRVTLVTGPGSLIAAMKNLQVSTVNPSDLPIGPPRAAQYLASAKPDAILFGPDVPINDALAVAGEIDQNFSEIDVVLIAEPTRDLLADAMKNGVREVVDVGANDELIGATVSRVAAAAGLRRTRLAGCSSDSPASNGEVIAVMAAKGGVGKTTVAVNLAVELARSAPNEVVVVDLDLVAGEVDLLLGLKPSSTVATVATPGAVLDPTVVKLSLSPHRSGVLTLAAPRDLIEADGVDPDLLVEVLAMLRTGFRHVVVDTAPGAGAALAAAVESADHLLAIATPDLGGLRSLKRNLDGLQTLGLTTAKRHLVLNRSDYRSGIGSQTIEGTVEIPVGHAIAESSEIAIAANQAVPFVDAFPGNEAVKSFKELASDFGATADEASPPLIGRRGVGQNRGRAA